MADDRKMTPASGMSSEEGDVEIAKHGHTRARFLKRVGVAGTGAVLAGNVAGVATAGASAEAVGAKYKNKTIGFALLTSSDENQASIVKWAKQAAKSAGLNWTWVVTDTMGDPAQAGTTIDSYVTKKVDGMMMVGIGAGSVESQLAKAKSVGIPMIGTYTFAPATSSIAQDFTLPPDADATLLGNYLIADQLKRHPSGTIKVAMLDFPPNVIQARRFAFKALIAQQSRFKIVAENYTISLTSTAQAASSAAQALIRSHPDLSAIWCNYPPIAVPAASGVAQSGKKVQVYGHIAQSSGVEAVRTGGPLVATSWVDWPFVGYSLVDQMLEAFSGRKPNRQLSVLAPDPAIVFDKTNVGREVPKGTKAADWMFAGGTYRASFLKTWGKVYV